MLNLTASHVSLRIDSSVPMGYPGELWLVEGQRPNCVWRAVCFKIIYLRECNVNAVTQEVPPWCNVFFLDKIIRNSSLISIYYRDEAISSLISIYYRDEAISSLISIYFRDKAIFYLDINLLPRQSNFLPWCQFTTVTKQFLPWYHFTTVMRQFSTMISIYYRDETISTLMSI